MHSNTRRRHAFCRWYLTLGNAEEAARRAGFPPGSAAETGQQLLTEPACRRLLAKLSAQPPLPMQALVTAGLARLAFGAANDAAVLAFSDAPHDADSLRSLDLFHVTAMKVDKNGIEIKLADRQRAMEQLLRCADTAGSAAAAAALMAALSGSGKEDGADDSLFPQAEAGAELVEAPADGAV